MMESFDKFVHEWGFLILLLALYSVMKHGKKNRMKYKKWDAMRAKQRRAKWKAK